jgi:hypothetical protein
LWIGSRKLFGSDSSLGWHYNASFIAQHASLPRQKRRIPMKHRSFRAQSIFYFLLILSSPAMWGQQQPGNWRVDGTWTDTSSTCGGSTYTLRQTPDGTIQSVTIKVSCNGGRITGYGAGSGMTWKNATTLGWSYRYSSHTPELIETGVSELVFAADGKTARLTTHDNAGNSGTSVLVLAPNTSTKFPAPASTLSSNLRVNGTWTDTSSTCGGSTYTLRQTPDSTIQSVTIKVSCNGGRITGYGAGSGMTWKNATTLGWSYRYSSHTPELIETGVSELVFAADGKTARLTTHDNAGNSGTSVLVLAPNTSTSSAAPVSTPPSQPRGDIVNLALYKPATQSSVYRETGVDQGPQFGNDGILGSQPRDPYLLVITNADDPSWWQVDLQGVYTLTQLKLYNRKACCQDRAKTIQVLLSIDGSNWERAYAHDGTTFDVLTVDLTGRSARYVRLQLTERNSLNFQECEVYGYANVPLR